ncbi:hypothetical protein [Rhizobium sp. A37_96]
MISIDGMALPIRGSITRAARNQRSYIYSRKLTFTLFFGCIEELSFSTDDEGCAQWKATKARGIRQQANDADDLGQPRA